jgi:hypothetical protein
MNFAHDQLSIRGALIALLLSILIIVPALVVNSQPAPNPFNEQRFLLSPTPTPAADSLILEQHPAKKSIPRGLIIAIVAVLILAGLVVLAFSVRAWLASNLFDREYQFPPVTSVATRLGAKRTGGCMATIQFGKKQT